MTSSIAVLGASTSSRGAADVAVLLQDSGLEACAVLTPPELVDDPHLAARGFFVTVDDDDRERRLPGSPLTDLADPTGPAPAFGAHTASVLAEVAQVER